MRIGWLLFGLVACTGSATDDAVLDDTGVPADDTGAGDDTGEADADTDADSDADSDTDSDTDADTDSDTDADTDADTDTDPAVPLTGWGTLSGDCGQLDATELTGGPYRFRNAIDFPTGGYLTTDLSAGGLEVLNDGNLGGSSLDSEIFAYEVLYRCELATLLKTEAEVVYDVDGKKTDMVVDIDGYTIGVSVTRAFTYPMGTPWPEATASTFLAGKLTDAQEASANVSAADRWEKQILAVLAVDAQHADMAAQVWDAFDASVKADTILWVTVTDGDDAFVY